MWRRTYGSSSPTSPFCDFVRLRHISDKRVWLARCTCAFSCNAVVWSNGYQLRTIQGDVLSTIYVTMCFQPLEPPPAHVLLHRTPVAAGLLVHPGLLQEIMGEL